MSATPDSGFMRKLKELDPKLGCEFDYDTEVFFITYERATGRPVPILIVKNVDGSFRQPDDREIKALHEGDRKRVDQATYLAKAAKYMEDARAKTARDRKSNIRDYTKDDKIQLMRALNPNSKANRPFRQIAPKVTGKVF